MRWMDFTNDEYVWLAGGEVLLIPSSVQPVFSTMVIAVLDTIRSTKAEWFFEALQLLKTGE